MKDDTPKGIARLVAALLNSRAGLRDMWRREAAFRQEAIVLVLSVPVAIWVGTSIGEIGLLIGSILFLMIVEILNSAIEAVVDRIGPERHELSRIAKDLGSAAVFLALLVPVSVWAVLVLNRLGVIAV